MDGNGVLGETRSKLNSLSICDENNRGNAKQGYGRSSDTDSPSCSSDKTAQFKMLIADARQMVTEEKLHDALELYEKALSLCYSDKLANRITKLKAFIKENIQTENHITTKERNSPVKSGRILSSGSENRQASSIATDQEGISEEEERRFRKLLSTSKELTAQGRIQEALELNKIALTICHSDKLAKRIAKMEEYLGEKDQEGSKDHCTDNVSEVQSSREDSSTQDSSSVTQQRFTELISDAKMHTHNGEIQEALKKYKTALSLCYSEKLEKRIQKIQEYLDQNKEKDKSSPTEQATENDSEGQTSSSRTGSQGELSSGEQERFNKLVMEAKKLTSDGEVRAALEKNKEALKIFYSEKLQKRITKMEAYLSEYENKGESDEEDGGMVHIGNEFYIYKDLANKLYSHQRAGVLWMWGLHQKKKGGILGDDMGLGKTIQVISFLSGLFDMERCHSVLIVMPVSVIVNWEKEFTKWAPGINIEAFHGSSKKEKERALTKVQRRGGVLLTSYGLVVTSWEMLSRQNGREYKWDYLILDEGHKIKNPTKTAKAVHQVGAKNRIILTGTPIQNNLRELWALFDFVHQGSLLGTARTFKMEYENPITRARERDATAGERRLGLEMAESLKKIIAPYFLRRTKAEVLKDEKEPQESNKAPAAKMPSLTRKNDFIVWLYLTEAQQRIYSDFLSLDTVKELLMTKKSPLVALNVLKKICDHPRLLSTRACAQLGLDGEDRLDDSDLESEAGFQCAVNQIKNMQDEVLINESGKLIVVVELLDKNKAEGHRTLLFSQSRKMLDIIQQVITNRGHKVMRLDGTVTHLSDRDQRIQKFQTDQSYSVFLLTTQVGGVGLTLTAADRVVIYDPSWNPATDAQAVDRVFRIGQDKNVVIYRLITCGTVEEKIYRRQVFKDSITRQTTGNSKNPYRYFTKQELRELFTLDNPRYSKTQQQLEEMHSGHRNTDSSLDAHVAFLYYLEIFGLSDHDLMFTNAKCDIDYDDDDVGGADVEDGNDYIQHRVQKAQELLKMESELSQDFNDRVSKYPRNIDVGDQAGTRRPVSQPWSNWTMEGMVNISKENDGGADTGVKKEVKNDEGCIDLTTIHHNSNKEEVIDLSSPVPSPVKVKAEPTVKVEHTDTENSAEKISNHISEDVFPKIKTEKESPGKISESEVYSMKVEPESHSDTDVNDDQLSMTGSDDNKSVPTDSSTDSEDESEGLDDPLSMSQTENNIMASNENDAADHETVHSPNVQLSMSGSEQGVTGPGTTENVSNPRLSKSDSDDDKMNNSLSREKSFVIKESIQGSNMSQDKNLESEAVNNNKTYTPKHSHVQEMSSPKSQTRTKTPKSRRKSVSASPWLKNTPKKGHQDVIEEELLISPDGRHPLISSKRTISSSSDVSPCKSVNLNSTILSVFGESPVPHKLSNRSKVGSHLCSNSNLGMTFIEESPVGDKVSDQVYKTVVENSPGYSANRSRTSSDDVVFDSPESKSTSRKSELLNNNSSSVGETDDESSPKKSKSDGRHNVDNSDDDINDKVPNSDDENTEKVLDSDKEDTNSEINKRRSVKSSDLRADNHMTESDQDSDDSLPCLSRKTLQKKRYAVIESDDDEDNDLEDDEGSVEQDSDDEMKEDDGKPTESAQTRDKMNNQVIISSNEEDNVDSGNRVHRNAYVEGSDEEELEDEEGSDMSGFIVDDDDEEEETEEEEEESEEEEDDEKSAFDDLPRKMKVQYQQYMKNGRSLYKSGEYNEALANFLQALEIFPDPALQAMALKCHQKMN